MTFYGIIPLSNGDSTAPQQRSLFNKNHEFIFSWQLTCGMWVIQFLNDNHVRYLIVGGYAVAVHGHPRYTKDIDIWIEINPENAANLLCALEQFGFGSLGLQLQDFLSPDQIIQLGYPPNRIDLLTSIDGVDFADCYSSRLEINVGNIIANFIDLENLKKNKEASGRLQDLADLENLN